MIEICEKKRKFTFTLDLQAYIELHQHRGMEKEEC